MRINGNGKIIWGGFAIIAIALVVICLTLLNNTKQSFKINLSMGEFEGILREVKENRKISSLPEKELMKRFKEKFLYKYEEDEPPKRVMEVPSGISKNNINEEMAIEDIGYLFDFLKYGYGGYGYFGGDAVFLKAKENMVSDVKKLKGNINRIGLEKIITRNLDFIQDGHFSVDKSRLCKDYNMFINEKEEIVKEGQVYYFVKNNNKSEILSIKDKSPKEYIKPSLNNDGELVYRLCFQEKSDKEKIVLKVKLKEENNDIEVELKNMARINNSQGSKEQYVYKEKDGIPYIDLNTFVNSKELERFSEEGKLMADKKALIIDLRGNSGGNEMYAFDWIKNFSNQEYSSSGISVSLNNNLTIDAMLRMGRKIADKESYPELERQIREAYKNGGYEEGFKQWSKIDYGFEKTIENNVPIFVLMDMNTASAGESFVEALKSMKNTIFIGSNSSGTGNIGNVGEYTLPNSGISLCFGSTLFLDSNLEWRDGIGIQPDFWVSPNDADKRVIKFIKNHSK